MSKADHRRWRRVGIAAAIAVVAALLAYGIFLVVSPRVWPSLRRGEQYGIDVSRHQGTIDWDAVADDGIRFAYLKSTEGGDWVDPMFERNWNEARAAGLAVGAYHFFRTCTDGAAQARNVLDTVPDVPGTLPIALDVESDGVCDRVDDPRRVRAEFHEMIELIEAERGPVVLYVLSGFEYLVERDEERPMWRRLLWIRPRDDWAIWQSSWFVHVDGIDGPVDLNVMDAAAADRWLT